MPSHLKSSVESESDTRNKAIGARLAVARQQAGYKSRKDAAKALDIPFSTLSGHENGTSGISQGVTAYARAYGVSTDWLLLADDADDLSPVEPGEPVKELSRQAVSTVQQRVSDRLSELNMDMKEASLAAGLGETFVRDLLVRRTKLGPSVGSLAALADVLGCSLAHLVGGADQPTDMPFAQTLDLRLPLEEVRDLLTALDLIGSGLGLERGHAVSAVAIEARTKLDAVLAQLDV